MGLLKHLDALDDASAHRYHFSMRTTLTLDPDVAAEVERLRSQGLGVSEAVNQLARAGMTRPVADVGYRHRTVDLGLKVDVANIGDVLDLLDER